MNKKKNCNDDFKVEITREPLGCIDLRMVASEKSRNGEDM